MMHPAAFNSKCVELEGRSDVSNGSPLSRSTSAGSDSLPSFGELHYCREQRRPCEPSTPASRRGTTPESDPEYWFWMPLTVKNTFIEVPCQRMVGSAAERKAHSCISRFELPSRPCSQSVHSSRPASTTVAAEPSEPRRPKQRSNTRGCVWESSTVVAPVHFFDAAFEEQTHLGQAPTLGSRGHLLGNCKPCAFYHTKGCRQGQQCEFCHLCDAGEKKRRRREKVALLRATRISLEAQAWAGY